MKWRWSNQVLIFCLFATCLIATVFSEYMVSMSGAGWLRALALEVRAACRDPSTQWMVFLCAGIYFIAFTLLAGRLASPPLTPPRRGTWNVGNPDLWLVGLMVIVAVTYGLVYWPLNSQPSTLNSAVASTQSLVLLACVALGKGISVWTLWAGRETGKRESGNRETNSVQLPAKPKGVGSQPEVGRVTPCAPHPPSSIPGAHGVTRPTDWNIALEKQIQIFIGILVLMLASAALWQPETTLMEYQYRGVRRWSGAWDNPNIYGMLMAVGMVLAMGLLVRSPKPKVPSSGRSLSAVLRRLSSVLWLLASGLCGFGLLKSYSRGAWLGAAIGVGYLVWQWSKARTHLTPALSPRPTGGEGEFASRFWCGSCVSWLRNSFGPLSVVLLSVVILSFWQFRHTEWPPARRVFSVANINDFSWRNRVTAWQGALQMMTDRPLVGFGWGKAEAAYRNDYRAARLEETAAIQMNDYLMLGISTGVPALLCFVAYLALSFRTKFGVPPSGGSSIELRERDTLSSALCLQTSATCRAGALVLITGFWFDGGLFKLPTAAVFWTLMELGRLRDPVAAGILPAVEGGISAARMERRNVVQLSHNPERSCLREVSSAGLGSPALRQARMPAATVLWWVAGLFAFAAVALTALHVTTPRLSVSERTLTIARNWLIQPAHRNDFDFLAAKGIWNGKPLSRLLDHVALADYNRRLVSWKIDDETYRDFVLFPQISPAYDADMNWRRPLWEHFYPRIRRESDPQAAVEIVIRELSKSLELQTDSSAPANICVLWTTGRADSAGFEAASVAALRAIGIPSRLNESGKGEWFYDGGWRPLPTAIAR